MRQIECIKTVRIAHDGEPHKPQTALFAGYVYDVPSDVCKEHAQFAVEQEWAIEVKPEEGVAPAPVAAQLENNNSALAPINEVNDNPLLGLTKDSENFVDVLESATKDELKDYVKTDADMDAEINLNLGREKLIVAVKEFLGIKKDTK